MEASSELDQVSNIVRITRNRTYMQTKKEKAGKIADEKNKMSDDINSTSSSKVMRTKLITQIISWLETIVFVLFFQIFKVHINTQTTRKRKNVTSKIEKAITENIVQTKRKAIANNGSKDAPIMPQSAKNSHPLNGNQVIFT